ncbi:MAG: alpha-amylase, partial [Bacteroidaceae bacterium]|nr:alpha-amylase [Bacteroidaceae bacterium]
FKAWLQTAHQDQARNFTIYFNGEDDATGIAEALGLDSDKVEIYDLSGRKLSGYQKGINIVNGKKIFK